MGNNSLEQFQAAEDNILFDIDQAKEFASRLIEGEIGYDVVVHESQLHTVTYDELSKCYSPEREVLFAKVQKTLTNDDGESITDELVYPVRNEQDRLALAENKENFIFGYSVLSNDDLLEETIDLEHLKVEDLIKVADSAWMVDGGPQHMPRVMHLFKILGVDNLVHWDVGNLEMSDDKPEGMTTVRKITPHGDTVIHLDDSIFDVPPQTHEYPTVFSVPGACITREAVQALDQRFIEPQLTPQKVEDITPITEAARLRPPSGDMAHVLVEDGLDPHIKDRPEGIYYCTVNQPKDIIQISEPFQDLKDICGVPLTNVWPPVNAEDIPPFKEIWSPHLEFPDGKPWIYFALYNGRDADNRVHVLKGLSDDPRDEYEYKGKIQFTTDRWAIDLRTFRSEEDGELYAIWSGWAGKTRNKRQNLYIARMQDPMTPASDRVCISTPDHEWEKQGGYPYVNEGPEPLQRNRKLMVMYSPSGSWSDDYCTGLLVHQGGEILDPKNWKKRDEPLMTKSDTVPAPGRVQYTEVGGEPRILYSRARSFNAGWARMISSKLIHFDENDEPVLGEAL
ncbi:MAG TPA: family 43 glycosylhydrolase [Candidatus Limnocylindrales bacterium]|nr:family 43 glycosylhydrolase [Candidatus Limnocylindrales bacterium]